MTTLRRSTVEELDIFHEMEQQEHAQSFINYTSLQTHREYFADPRIVYLSIENNEHLVGYFILALEADRVVEFRRIVVDRHQRGTGQKAIGAMERYCREQLGASRIWLDVYEDNERGIHIYEKLGFKRFREEIVRDRRLLFYEKTLPVKGQD